MQYAPSTQPENLIQTLSRSWSLYRATFLKAFLLALIIALIEFTPRIMMFVMSDSTIAVPYVWLRIFLLLCEFVDIVLFAAILWHIQSVALNRHESLRTDFRLGLKKLPTIIIAAFIQLTLYGIICVSAMVIYYFLMTHPLTEHPEHPVSIFLVGIPVIVQFLFTFYLFFLLYFYLPLILTENNGPINSLFHSARLVWNNWWKTFWVVVTPWFVYVAVLVGLKMLGAKFSIYTSQGFSSTPLATAIHILVFALFIPWFAATMLVQLRNLEMLKEPLPIKAAPKKSLIKKPLIKIKKILKKKPKAAVKKKSKRK
jgi:hypothetical protein